MAAALTTSRGLLLRSVCLVMRGVTIRQDGRSTCTLFKDVTLLATCRRQLSAKSIEAPASPIGSGPGTTGIFTRFWRWLNDEAEEKVISQEEKQEREELLRRVQDMYFAKPPVAPSLDFYREVFRTLIKYNDRVGVETLCRFMEEMKVVPDPELLATIEGFKEKAQRNVWFE